MLTPLYFDRGLKTIEVNVNLGTNNMTTMKKVNRWSNRYTYIKTTDQFIQERDLFERFLRMIQIDEIEQGHAYIIPADEKDDDLIQLLIDLDIIEYDWDNLSKQTHHTVGNRIIEFSINGDKAIELYARISGKGGRIRKETLNLIAKDIASRFTLDEIAQLFEDLGVPKKMFIDTGVQNAVFYILSYYSTSRSNEDHLQLLRIVQKILHPLTFGGDAKKTAEAQKRYKEWLQYDDVQIENNAAYFAQGSTSTDKASERIIVENIDSDKITVNHAKNSRDNLLINKELKPEISTGKLVAYNDGTIRYDGEIMTIRNQLKDICRLFMRNSDRLLTIDDIKDCAIRASKRDSTSHETISKYVSELHTSLKNHFKKDVIFNQKEEGWWFKT